MGSRPTKTPSESWAEHPVIRPLSSTELKVVHWISHGLRNETIAAQMNVGLNTIKDHVVRILRKLRARDRAHAVGICMRQGLLVTNPTTEPDPAYQRPHTDACHEAERCPCRERNRQQAGVRYGRSAAPVALVGDGDDEP